MDIQRNFRGNRFNPDDIDKFHDSTRDITGIFFCAELMYFCTRSLVQVIFTFLLPLGCFAYFLICKYRRRQDSELEVSHSVHFIDDDAFASRFVILASTIGLTVSQGAILLLPCSVLANEIIHSFPDNYYFQWLNNSVIHDLWNLITLLSHISLVTLIYAYFLSESEGFDGGGKGLSGRVKESLVTILFALVFLSGVLILLYHILNYDTWDFLSFEKLMNLHKLALPWFHTCLSFIGAVILLISTPYGYAKMFTVVGKLVKRPLLASDASDLAFSSPQTARSASVGNIEEDLASLEEHFEEHLNPSFFRRTLLYPVLMLLLLLWTSFCILVCFWNLVKVTFGFRDLPGVSRLADVGITSLSSLGLVGAFLEILIIAYIVLAFLVGFYSLPWIGRIRPRLRDTSLPQIVANCALILLLSSSLPLFVRVLGITNFDLLGSFVHVSWLRNLRVIVGYNVLYLVASVLVLTAHATKAVWQAICERLKIGTSGIKKVARRSGNSAFKERLIASKLFQLSTKNGYLKKQS